LVSIQSSRSKGCRSAMSSPLLWARCQVVPFRPLKGMRPAGAIGFQGDDVMRAALITFV
jgi:hypothetical protein